MTPIVDQNPDEEQMLRTAGAPPVKLDRGILVGAVIGMFVGLIFGTLALARQPVESRFGLAMIGVTAYTIAVGAILAALREWLDGAMRYAFAGWIVALTLPAAPVTIVAVLRDGWWGLLILPVAAFMGVMSAAAARYELRPWLKRRKPTE